MSRESELNDYLVAFGEIHCAKLLGFLTSIPFAEFESSGLILVDWGCGQGLATAVTLDYIRSKFPLLKIVGVRMIEIAPLALDRAMTIVRKYFPDSQNVIEKYAWSSDALNSISENLPDGVPVLHLFSNILDVRALDLDAVHVAVERMRSGRHSYVISVGPDRETTTSAPVQLLTFYKKFGSPRPLHVCPDGSGGRIYGNWKYWPYAYCKCYGFSYVLKPTAEVSAMPEPHEADIEKVHQTSILPAGASTVVPLPPPPDIGDFFMYASADMIDELESAIKSGMDVNVRNEKGATALYFAAKHGSLLSVRMLLEHGANTELSVFGSGMTPYLIAVKYERVDVVRILASAGSDVKVRDRKGRGAVEIVRVYNLCDETAKAVSAIDEGESSCQ